VGGGAELLKLLVGEDVDGDQMDLSVAVLSGLGGGHFDDLARAVLDDDETGLPQSRALHGVGSGGTGIGALECVLMLQTTQSVYGLTKRRTTLRAPGRNWRWPSEGWGKEHMRGWLLENVPARRPPWCLNES
jgi:hypothetical protein